MTRWYHKCDIEWLKARQKCLTATDVKELLPVTRTGRKRTIDDESYLKIMARKIVQLNTDDCISTGAAARGHILEPYAVDLFNSYGEDHLYHWDDVVITRPGSPVFGLAFSPDAMNEIMDYEIRRSNKRVFEGSTATVIGEVKSYSPEKHMLGGYTYKGDLEERWQIATAMAVCPSIDLAYLLFFNPSMKNQLYIVDYDRNDLSSEIDMILEVEDKWLGWVSNLGKLDRAELITGDSNREQEIIDSIIKSEEMNPDGEKSVVR